MNVEIHGSEFYRSSNISKMTLHCCRYNFKKPDDDNNEKLGRQKVSEQIKQNMKNLFLCYLCNIVFMKNEKSKKMTKNIKKKM